MSDVAPQRRKVLIIEDEPSIRNVLYVLLAAMGCEGDVATSGRQALAMVSRESFDAVLLDLRCLNVKPEDVVSEIRQINPRLVGRVLVITGEVADAKTLSWLEKSCLPSLEGENLVREFRERVKSLLGMLGSPKPVS